jgi:hypothetical protein
MVGDHTADYLAGLPHDQAAELDSVNGPGLTALRGYLDSGGAVAFLGAGVSAPLYPLRDGLIGDLVDAAAGRLEEREAETIRALARESPEEVVEVVRRELGVAGATPLRYGRSGGREAWAIAPLGGYRANRCEP